MICSNGSNARESLCERWSLQERPSGMTVPSSKQKLVHLFHLDALTVSHSPDWPSELLYQSSNPIHLMTMTNERSHLHC